VYNLRSHKYYGFTDALTETFPAGRVKLYALLDYQVGSVKIKVDSVKLEPGGSVRLQLAVTTGRRWFAKPSAAVPDLHVFQIRVTNPRGIDLEEYARVLSAPNGTVDCALHLALDQLPGNYIVTVSDVVSGKQADATFTVVSRKP